MADEDPKVDPLVGEFIKFGCRLCYGSRFFSSPSPKLYPILEGALGSLKTTLEPAVFFRARLHDSPRMDKPPEPFRGDDIRNPQSEKAVAGRLNCAGISRLYLSSTEDIAAAEVRAITADFVTIAKFALREPIAVFDFRQINFRAKDESSELLSYIGRIIATPVFGHDNYESILSQWITEYIEKSGAHALIFPSVMRGRPKEEHSFIHSILKISPREFFNVCAFYPSQFELLEASPIVTRVRELTLTVMDDVRFYKLRALDEIQEKLKQGGTAALKSEEVPPSSAPDGAPPSGSS